MKKSLVVLVIIGMISGTVAGVADNAPWYRDYFSMITMPHHQSDEALKEARATAWRSSLLYGGWYGGWYLDWQKTTRFFQTAEPRMNRFFERHLMYYDGGEVGDFLLFLDRKGNIVHDAWDFYTWNGTPALTAFRFGIDTFFKDESPLSFPNYSDFKLKQFTYPDGRIATNVYEVLGRRDVNGILSWNEPWMNEKVTDEQARLSGLDKISKKQFFGEHFQGRNGWIMVQLMTQDYANQQLSEYQAWEMAYLTRTVKPDGWHIDNFGDNNLYRPFEYSFGVWSEYTFKEFMKKNFSAKELSSMGIRNVETFDIKEYVRARRMPGQENPYIAYNELKWKDDLIFKCYMVNHAQQSADFHKLKYSAIKDAAKEAGIECLVSGNAIPVFAGYTLVNGYLDVSHFEWQSTREYEATRRPLGLPPAARSGYISRLATAIGRENYSIISLYVPHNLRGEKYENLFLAQGFEALANRAVIDFAHQYLDMYSPGSPRTAGIFNQFLKTYKRELSRRDFVADFGVVYDQWADIASATACQLDVNDFFNEYAGWCDYMADTHRQWRVVLSSNLAYEKIKDMPVLILPSTLSLSDQHYEAIEMYLQNGGRVLATGLAGFRHGPEGYLMKRKVNPLDALKKYENFRWITKQPASEYWLSKNQTAAKQMTALIRWKEFNPVVETDAEIHVGVTLSRSLDGEPKSLSLDLNNNNFNPETDKFTKTKPFKLKIQLPPDFPAITEITVAEPEKRVRKIDFSVSEQILSLEIVPFEIYQFIQIFPK